MPYRKWLAGLGVVAVLLGAGLLRGWLVPASRGDLAPEAYGWRLRWPWAPRAEVTVFFPTTDGAPFVAVARAVDEATPLTALKELAAGPAPGSGLGPALPSGLIIQSVDVEGGTATVRVAGAVPDEGALAVMARTLQGHATAMSVIFDDGSAVGPIPVPVGDEVTYLWRGLPVPVAADGVAGDPARAVARLLDGPAPTGADALPGGISLAGVRVKGDLATVSLTLSPGVTEELTAGRWEFAAHAMAIVYTLTDQPGIRRVQFDFPDLPEAARRNCRTPLGVPLVRPDAEAGRAKGGA